MKLWQRIWNFTLNSLRLSKPYSPLRKGKKNFVFIHINKNGGTSISQAIGMPQKQHYTVQETIDQIGGDNWKEAYTFSIVRNPWDRALSLYEYRVRTNQTGLGDRHLSFEQWLEKCFSKQPDPAYHQPKKMFLPQSDWLKNREGKINLNHIGRFENLAEEFNLVRKEIGITRDLPHLNSGKNRDYKKHYTDASKNLIAEYFSEDIRRFDYAF